MLQDPFKDAVLPWYQVELLCCLSHFVLAQSPHTYSLVFLCSSKAAHTSTPDCLSPPYRAKYSTDPHSCCSSCQLCSFTPSIQAKPRKDSYAMTAQQQLQQSYLYASQHPQGSAAPDPAASLPAVTRAALMLALAERRCPFAGSLHPRPTQGLELEDWAAWFPRASPIRHQQLHLFWQEEQGALVLWSSDSEVTPWLIQILGQGCPIAAERGEMCPYRGSWTPLATRKVIWSGHKMWEPTLGGAGVQVKPWTVLPCPGQCQAQGAKTESPRNRILLKGSRPLL